MVQALRDLVWVERATGVRLWPFQRRIFLAMAMGYRMQMMSGRRGPRMVLEYPREP